MTLLLIVVLAAGVRFWGLAFGLPHTYARPDETVIIDVSLQFLQGNFRPRFYHYPWMYMWTTTAVYLVYYAWGSVTGAFGELADLVGTWRTNWAPFFLMNRAVSAVMGAALVPVLHRIARRLWGEATGLVAALFGALAFLHVRESHYGTTDAMMTLFVMLSVALLLEAHATRRRVLFAAAGLAGGIAAGTKYNGVLLVAPLAVSYLLNAIDRPAGRARALVDGRVWWFGLPFAAAFIAGAPFIVTDTTMFIDEMNALRENMAIGIGERDLDPAWLHHLKYSLRFGVGLPMMLAGLAGAAAIVVRDVRTGALLFSFPVAYYAVLGTSRNQFFRYALPVVPFLCLGAARAITLAVEALGPRAAVLQGRPAMIRTVTAVLALGVAAPSALSTFHFDRIMSRTDNRVVIARWFDRNVPGGTSIAMSGSQFGYVQFSLGHAYQVWVWDRHRLRFVVDRPRGPAEGRPAWILLQDSPIPSETQPIITEWLSSGYVEVRQFTAFSQDERRLYDRQDGFYVPFSGFDGVVRPGPNYTLYRDASAP